MQYQCEVVLREGKDTKINGNRLLFHNTEHASSGPSAERQKMGDFAKNIEEHIEIRCDPAIGR